MRLPRLLTLTLCLSPALALALATPPDPTEQILAATFRIFDKDSSGTCFLVHVTNEEHSKSDLIVLVTAAHVLEGMKGSECQLALRQEKSDGEYARREISIKVRDGDKPRWRRHSAIDVAALPIELPENVSVSPFEFDQIANETAIRERKVHLGQEVWLPGFPAQLEANPAGWPILRKGSIATFPLTPVKSVKTFLVDIHSFGGDSGAPVVAIIPAAPDSPAAQPLVTGLILGMQRQTDKASLPFEELTLHTPLGLAIVAESPFIRETIQQIVRDRDQTAQKREKHPTTAPAA